MAKKLPDISGIENKINVGLYGGKSFFKGVRDTKYRAEVIPVTVPTVLSEIKELV